MILPAAAAMIAIAVTSCVTSTPTTRIKKSPEVFQQLSPADQELAKQGQVKQGMERNAVLIALGEPDKISQGSKDSKAFEKWYYASSRPVHRTGVNIGLGYGGYGRGGYGRGGYRSHGRYGYGGYGRHGGYGGYGLNHGVTYVNSLSSIVEFDASGRVKNWSQTQ